MNAIIICMIFLTFFAFMTSVIAQAKIVRRLRELNDGVEHPLVSKDGVFVNIYNKKFSIFIKNIDRDEDEMLYKCKRINRYGQLIGLLLFILTGIATCIVN